MIGDEERPRHGAAAALLGAIQQAVPGDLHDMLPAALVRRLVGGPTADALGVPRPTGLTRVRWMSFITAPPGG